MTNIERLHRAGGGVAACLMLIAACSSGDSGSPPPPPALVAARAPISGNAQTGTVGQPLASPIRVLVTRDGAPEPGATVTWAATGTGASIAPPSGVTDAAGLAQATWTLPQAAGARTATAAVADASGSPVSFSATANPGPATQLNRTGGNGQSGSINVALPTPLQVTAVDQFGNGVAGVGIAWQVNTRRRIGVVRQYDHRGERGDHRGMDAGVHLGCTGRAGCIGRPDRVARGLHGDRDPSTAPDGRRRREQ